MHARQVSTESSRYFTPLNNPINLIVPTFEGNGMFVLGWVFFLQTNFDFLTSQVWRIFLISLKRYCWTELKFENIFHLWSLFVKLWEISFFKLIVTNWPKWKFLKPQKWFVTRSGTYSFVVYMAPNFKFRKCFFLLHLLC